MPLNRLRPRAGNIDIGSAGTHCVSRIPERLIAAVVACRRPSAVYATRSIRAKENNVCAIQYAVTLSDICVYKYVTAAY